MSYAVYNCIVQYTAVSVTKSRVLPHDIEKLDKTWNRRKNMVAKGRFSCQLAMPQQGFFRR